MHENLAIIAIVMILYTIKNIIIVRQENKVICNLFKYTSETMNKQVTPWLFKAMVTGLYLIQGMFYGFVYSLPLSYQHIPSYYILGIFALSNLPFSFKFILTPVVERYTSFSYGRKKTWLVGSVFLCSVLLCVMAKVAEVESQEYQKYTAYLLLGCVCCVAIKDIAADGLTVNTLDAKFISTVTFVGDQIGKLITLPLFLAVISKDFFEGYGLSGPLLSKQVYIYFTAFIGFGMALFMHFWFDQHKIMKISLQSQDKIQQSQESVSFRSIFNHYKKFFNPVFRLCRKSILLLLINAGLQVFAETYPVELVRVGVRRQKLTLALNLCLVPNLISIWILSYFLRNKNYQKFYYFSCIAKYLTMFLLFTLDLHSQTLAIASFVFYYIVGSIHYYLENVCINSEAKGEFAGLSVTLLLSLSNLSRMTVLQKMLMEDFGYDQCILGCLWYGFGLFMLLPQMGRWSSGGASLREKHQKLQ